jgi:hypothetical protein
VAQKSINPLDERDVYLLRQSMDWSRERLRRFRENRKDAIDQYTGGSYGDGGDSGSVPLNMMELAVNVYQRQLASDNPQVLCTSQRTHLKPVAEELQIGVNHLLKHAIDFSSALNAVVVDALFCMGVMKVGVTPEEHEGINGFRHDAGQVYADPVGLEDWVHDMNARRYEEIDYAGNLYRVPLEEVMESPLFSKKAKDGLRASVRNEASYTDRNYLERPESLTGGSEPMPLEYHEHVDLWDIWLPRDRILVTMPPEGFGAPLRVVDWDGPDIGPFYLLGFASVPSNIMPLAPAMVWEDMHDLINRLFLKAGEQADRQKTVLAGQNRTKNAMEAIIQTPDGESLCTEVDPNLIKEFVFGGVDGNLMAALSQFKDLFSYLAGNLDALGGLGAQSQTVGQDRLLSSSASSRIADMQQKVLRFTESVVTDIAWYMWNDPTVDLALTKPITTGISRQFNLTPDSMEGDFFDVATARDHF